MALAIKWNSTSCLRCGDFLVNQRLEGFPEEIPTKVPRGLESGVGKERAAVCCLWLVHLSGHVTLAVVEEEGLVSGQETVCS